MGRVRFSRRALQRRQKFGRRGRVRNTNALRRRPVSLWFSSPGKIYVNDEKYARVTTPDVSVSNGVVHVVNRVLTPDWDSEEQRKVWASAASRRCPLTAASLAALCASLALAAAHAL